MFKRIIKKIIKILELLIKDGKGLKIENNNISGLSLDELIHEFDNISVENNSIIFIHSGFKSLGTIQGGPDTVVKALLESFVNKRNITIAMPSFTLSGSMESYLKRNIIFNVKETKTVYKGIPLAFQQFSNLQRSIHPTHSVMAIGPKAKWLVDSHHTCGSTFGEGSPFGKLLEHKSYIMGLGSRLGTVTFYHTLEDLETNFPFRVYTENSPFEAICIDHQGKKVKMSIYAHDGSISSVRIDRRNGEWLREIYTSIFEEHADLKWFHVGKAKTWVCSADKMYEVQKQLTFSGISIYSSEKDIANYISKTLSSSSKQID
jgi:aminoglycoside 3-N-acetyltransferase